MNSPDSSARTRQTVIITGGSTGIGFATAHHLLETKLYRVAIIGRQPGHLEKAAERLGGTSDWLSTHVCDLANEDEIAQTFEKIARIHKGVFGLVNNAGIYPFGGVASTASQQWDQVMQVNLKAPFLATQAVVPYLEKNPEGGRIVNISSTAGLLPNHFALAYSVSKAGLIHLTRTMAKDLGKNNITVNCISPGIVKTPLHEEYHPDRAQMEQFFNKRGSEYPLGRVGEPTDIVGAIEFFLGPQSSWVTGTNLVIDGGRLLT